MPESIKRIIFSRKGFDSSYGGVPSPIFPDGEMVSLPIAERNGGIPYSSLYSPSGRSLGKVVERLTSGGLNARSEAHLDPDLFAGALKSRPRKWRPVFGQCKAAQSHLINQGVGRGDLFLFFGWFREVEWREVGWTYKPDAENIHVIFGWLQVGEVLALEGEVAPEWAKYHHHVKRSELYPRNNTLFISADSFQPAARAKRYSGAGVFSKYNRALRLTACDQRNHSRCVWSLPPWSHPKGGQGCLTYHSAPWRWQRLRGETRLETVSRGQEFVLDTRSYPEAMGWVRDLFETADAAVVNQ